MPTWLRRLIVVSIAITAYAIGVITAGWSPYWVPASNSTRNSHTGGGLCPSDKRLLEIFRAEVWGSVDHVERLNINSCEYGWAMVQLRVVMADGQSHDYMAMLHYDLDAKQWYITAKHWLYSSGGSAATV